MRILHLTTFLQGGAGLAIVELATAQAAAGHRVSVVASATPQTGYGNYPAHLFALQAAGIELELIDSMFTRDYAANLGVASQLARRRATYDIVHAHAAIPSLVALLLKAHASRRFPVVQTMHGWGIRKTTAIERTDVAILNLVDRVVVPSETSAELLKTRGVDAARVDIVPYGVAPFDRQIPGDDPETAEIRQWRAAGGDVACCVGTLGARKNQRLLLEALADIEDRDRLLCVFVGDGDAEPLRRLTTGWELDACVRFYGYRPQARRFAAASDFLVLPSLSEGQPLSILEAFCDGVPVAASAIPEIRELIEPGRNGYLFDPEDARALGAALTELRRTPHTQRAQVTAHARRDYEARFSVDAMVAGYMTQYAQVA